MDALLVGTSGEAAVLTYADEVSLAKPFESGDVQAAFRTCWRNARPHTRASGGAQLHFRTQRQLEDALEIIGLEMRSTYLLTYYPTTTEAGYHHVKVEVDSPGASVFARPGYWHMR